eukprot:g13015.t1
MGHESSIGSPHELIAPNGGGGAEIGSRAEKEGGVMAAEAEEKARGVQAGGVDVGCEGVSSPWAIYKRSMSERPLLTKSVTAAVVSALGEIAASALRPSAPPPPVPPLPGGLRQALVAAEGWPGVGPGAGVPGAPPSLLRRTAAFALFGLVLNGPLFHWWYGALERAAARRRKPGDPPGGAGDIAFKIALDRFLLTPPYLAITLASLRLLQGLGVKRSLREMRALYRGVLFTNWKVWTIAQLVNFKLVPVEFRPVFANFVACWWNVYLSLLSPRK